MSAVSAAISGAPLHCACLRAEGSRSRPAIAPAARSPRASRRRKATSRRRAGRFRRQAVGGDLRAVGAIGVEGEVDVEDLLLMGARDADIGGGDGLRGRLQPRRALTEIEQKPVERRACDGPAHMPVAGRTARRQGEVGQAHRRRAAPVAVGTDSVRRVHHARRERGLPLGVPGDLGELVVGLRDADQGGTVIDLARSDHAGHGLRLVGERLVRGQLEVFGSGCSGGASAPALLSSCASTALRRRAIQTRWGRSASGS